MKPRHSRVWPGVLGALTLLAVGCQTLFQKPTQWTVTPSALDYIEFVAPLSDAPGAPDGAMVQLMLMGNGYLSMRTGTSPRVTSGFWSEPKDDRWDQVAVDSLTVPPAFVLGCFQHLVDLGYYDDRAMTGNDASPDTPGVAVAAMINGRKKVRIIRDSRMREMVQEILRQF